MQERSDQFQELLDRIKGVIDGPGGRDERLLDICRLLQDQVDHYHWAGFYLVDESKARLLLGPYIGAPTRHTKIPFGQGVCGMAAEKRRTLMVPDVSKVVNYLSCSPKVKSEIVVPIFQAGQMVAELDIDSYQLDAFGELDKIFLEKVCRVVGGLFREVREFAEGDP